MMHGVKRNTESIPLETNSKQEEDEQSQIAHYRGLISTVLELRDKEDLDVATIMASTAELLLLNPDFMTAWNLRRRSLLCLIQSKDMDAIQQEFKFGIAAIKMNPKSYGAWYHRRWLIETLSRHDTSVVDVSHELELCAKLLELDSRNYGISLKTAMNFSNYSAWHRRTLLFPKLEPVIGEEAMRKAIKDDLGLIKSAYFTEPADQSCWFYLRWLMDFAGTRFFAREQLLKEELDGISELLAIEPESSLALFTWISIARESDTVSQEMISEKLLGLQRIDPKREGMYQPTQE